MQIKNICIGTGIPKICVPLVSATLDALLKEAFRAKSSNADLAEFRADYFDTDNPREIVEMLPALRDALGDMPMLFTFRTRGEGGKREISRDDYRKLNLAAAGTGLPDLLDVEISSGGNCCSEIITAARDNSVLTVLSSHDFDATPPRDEMLATLRMALKLGGDIPKLAVTPKTPADVLALLSVAEEFTHENPERPIIMMSMGQLGKISRVSGEFFGSAVSFASLEKATAPGQLLVDELCAVLRILHGK